MGLFNSQPPQNIDLPYRGIAMRPGDTLTNNTDYDIFLFDPTGEKIACVEPGKVFEASSRQTVTFDANTQYTFRSYINSGFRRN